MKYFKTERDYPFLRRLKENYLLLKRDFQEIFRFVDREKMIMLSTAKRVIRSSKTDWKSFAFVMHGKPPHEHMAERGFLPPYMDADGLQRFARAMNGIFFKESRPMLEEIANDPRNGIVSMWYSYFEPGAKLGLHVNNDPYMYRSLGSERAGGRHRFQGQGRDHQVEGRRATRFRSDEPAYRMEPH
jgi:hypothetical protein